MPFAVSLVGDPSTETWPRGGRRAGREPVRARCRHRGSAASPRFLHARFPRIAAMISSIGIDSIALAVPRGHVDLRDLAEVRGVPASKYLEGIGTNRMAVAAADEDPVTLAAGAARRA